MFLENKIHKYGSNFPRKGIRMVKNPHDTGMRFWAMCIHLHDTGRTSDRDQSTLYHTKHTYYYYYSQTDQTNNPFSYITDDRTDLKKNTSCFQCQVVSLLKTGIGYKEFFLFDLCNVYLLALLSIGYPLEFHIVLSYTWFVF